MYETGYNDGMLAMLFFIGAAALIIALVVCIYLSGRQDAQKEAAKKQAEMEKEYQARIAVAGLQGMRGGNLPSELNGLSREHLRNVTQLLQEK